MFLSNFRIRICNYTIRGTSWQIYMEGSNKPKSSCTQIIQGIFLLLYHFFIIEIIFRNLYDGMGIT